MTVTPEPTTNDHLRANVAMRRASELVARACAQHHGTMSGAPLDPLIDDPEFGPLDDVSVVPVLEAMGRILDHQLGPQEAIRRLQTIDAFNPYRVAELIAEVCGWDGAIPLRAAALATQRHRDHLDLATIAETTEPPQVEARLAGLRSLDDAIAAGVATGRYLTDADGEPLPGPRFADPDSLTEDTDLRVVQSWIDGYIDGTEQ